MHANLDFAVYFLLHKLHMIVTPSEVCDFLNDLIMYGINIETTAQSQNIETRYFSEFKCNSGKLSRSVMSKEMT